MNDAVDHDDVKPAEKAKEEEATKPRPEETNEPKKNEEEDKRAAE